MPQRHGKDGKFVGGGSSGSAGGDKLPEGWKAGSGRTVASTKRGGASARIVKKDDGLHVEVHDNPTHSGAPKHTTGPYKTPSLAAADAETLLTRAIRKKNFASVRTSVFADKELTPRQKQKIKNLPPALKEKAENKKAQASPGKSKPKPFAEDAPLPESWTGTLVVEGSTTDDGRMFSPGSLDWRDLPLPLAWQQENQEGHRGSVLVGRIDSIERDGDKLLGRGVFDLGSENGREAARLVRDGFLRGISVDVSVDDGQVTLVETDDGRQVTTFSAGRILGATVLPLQAFAEASISVADTSAQVAASAQPQVAAVLRPAKFGRGDTGGHYPRSEPSEWVLASAPVHPPAAWFANPNLDGPTGIVVEETGRVFGHLATWDTCHTSFGEGAGRCVRPPRSATSYAYFLTGELVTSEGSRVPVGHITVGGTHAPLRGSDNAPVSAGVASEHYENTGWVAADVAAGEDAYGIWVAGALRPGLSAEALREFRAAPLSGDWRRIGGTLELVGALAVNVPGFPVRRVTTLVASGEPVAFIAFPEPPACPCERDGGLEAIGERIARTVGLDKRSLADALAERVGVS